MQHSNAVHASRMGAEGSKGQAADSPPPDNFRPRSLYQSYQSSSLAGPDNAARHAREERDRLYNHNGSPSAAPLRGGQSPPLRQSFVPDRVGSRWEDLNRPSEWAARYKHERGDRWAQRPHLSSPPRRQSPPRRPSPSRPSSYGYAERPRSPSAHPSYTQSPGRHSRRDSDAFEPPSYFHNLSWKPSDQARSQFNMVESSGSKDAERIRAAAPSTSLERTLQDTDNGKVSYNGLKHVPTGPKRNSGVLPPVPSTVKSLPHIFVSSQHLPAQWTTHQHLYRALRNFVENKSDIRLDELGWYLCFDESDEGRATLQDCYRKRDRMKLFGQYTIHMELFPFGAQTPTATPNGDSVPLSLFNGIAEPEILLNGASSNAAPLTAAENTSAFLENGLIPGPNGVNVHQAVNGASAIARLIHENSSPTLPGMEAIRRRQSSPLRVPSRLDRDDSSSCISGPTGSDTSRSKLLKCHVCKTSDPFDSDVLVVCSSCPRRYHRRCHARPAIPAELETGDAWQCRRCIKKQVPPKSRLRSSSPAVNPVADRLNFDEPPFKRQRLDSTEPRDIPLSGLLDGAADHDISTDLNGQQTGSNAHGSLPNELHEVDTLHQAVPNSDETHFREADDLVAKSFALPTASTASPSAAMPIPKKPTFVRRKLSRPTNTHDREAPASQDAVPGPLKDPLSSATENSMPPNLNGSIEIDGEWHNSKRNVIRWNNNIVPKSATQMNGESNSDHRKATPNGTMKVTGESEIDSISDFITKTEIPESPEEMSKPSTQPITMRVNRTSQLNGSANVNDLLALGLDGVIGIEEEPAPRQERVKLQRVRPAGQMGDRCKDCGKKIAYNPSRTNKLCTKCKAAASAPPIADQVHHVSANGVDTTSETFASSKFGGKEKSEHGETKNSSQAPTARLDAPLSPVHVATEPAPEPERDLRESDQSKSCETCRLWNRSCNHSVPAPPPTHDSVLLENGENVKEHAEDDDRENVLDFWTASAAVSDKEEATGVYGNVLADVATSVQPENEAALSDAESASSETQCDEGPRKAVPKRTSQTRPAMSQHDLGDSIERPKGAYEKLIGMALCSVPDHRMRGTDVTRWVAKNIPGYKAGEGKWESSLRATLTLKKEGYGGKHGLWKKIEAVGAKKNETAWWELHPGQAEKMLHWDPVLMRPVSPPTTGSKKTKEVTTRELEDASEEDSPSPKAPAVPRGRRMKQPRRKRLQQGQAGRAKAVVHPEDTPERARKFAPRQAKDINSSSEEEPLVKRKRKVPKSASQVDDIDMADVAEPSASHPITTDSLEESKAVSQTLKAAPPANRQKRKKIPVEQPYSKPLAIEDMIAMEAKDNQYPVASLFDEYPEYDPKNHFDREAKIAEIKKRPKRKEKFGRYDPKTEMGSPDPVIEYTIATASPEKAGRNNALYPWEIAEANVVQCATLDELFNLPKNPVAIMHDGQLAYRDGTRNEDGSLPRAKVIYKTGYGLVDYGSR